MDVKTMKHNFQYDELFQIGSEDALSSVDDLNINEQLSMKVHTVEQVRHSQCLVSCDTDFAPHWLIICILSVTIKCDGRNVYENLHSQIRLTGDTPV